MKIESTIDKSAASHVLRASAALILLALGVGVFGGPWVYNSLVWLGRNFPALTVLRTVELEEVVSRLTLITLALGFLPVMNRLGHISWSGIGLTRRPDWTTQLLAGWLTGVGSIAFLYAGGMLAGGYAWSVPSWPVLLARAISFGLAGWVIAVVEEVFFRGILYGSARRLAPPVVAALLVALFFALVHFMRPMNPAGIVHGHWYSGLSLLPHLFHISPDIWYYIPFAITLFFMSLTLCARMERDGHLYGVMGLHAGWVLMLGLGKYFLERNPDRLGLLLGPGENMARSPTALIFMIVFLVFYIRCLKGRCSMKRCGCFGKYASID